MLLLKGMLLCAVRTFYHPVDRCVPIFSEYLVLEGRLYISVGGFNVIETPTSSSAAAPKQNSIFGGVSAADKPVAGFTPVSKPST